MLLCSTSRLKANEEPNLPCANIDTVYVTGGTNIGDTLQIHTTFTTKVNATFKYGMSFGYGLKELYSADSTRIKFQTQTLDSNQTVSFITKLLVKDSINTDISVSALLLPDPSVSTMYDKGSEQCKVPQSICLSIIKERWRNFDAENPTRATDAAIDGEPEADALNKGLNQFHIVGTVNYVDPSDSKIKGAFTRVRIYFRGTHISGETTGLLLPNPVLNDYVAGVHYADCDENGNFEFNFNCDFGSLTNIRYYLVVEKKNIGADVYSIAWHTPIQSILNPTNKFRVFPFNGKIQYVALNSANEYNYNFQNTNSININTYDGCVLRYCALAEMFLKDRLNVTQYSQLPFNTSVIGDRLPPITFNRTGTDVGYYAGSYGGNQITMKTKYIGRIGISHEFGHYIDDAMNNMLGCGSTNNAEAFAIFFTNAFLAWNNTVYGNMNGHSREEQIELSNNAELAPTFRFNWYDKYADRGSNLAKPWLTDGAAYGTFLYQLYDSQDEGVFTPEYLYYYWSPDAGDYVTNQTRGYNNDDIEFGKSVFDWWIANPNLSFEEFKNLALANSNNSRLDASITSWYNYLNSAEWTIAKPSPTLSDYTLDNTNRNIIFNSHSYKFAEHYITITHKNLGATVGSTSWAAGNWENFIDIYDANNYNNSLFVPIPNDNQITGTLEVPYSSVKFTNRNIHCYAANVTNGIRNETWVPMLINNLPLAKQPNMENSEIYASVCPNPVTNNSIIRINSDVNGTANIKIIAIYGKTIQSINSLNFLSGQNDVNLDLNAVSNGTYTVIVEIVNSDGITNINHVKFIKFN